MGRDRSAGLATLGAAGWSYAARRTLREYLEDDCIDSAAALTYFAVVSVFPGLLAVVALAGLVGEGRPVADGVLDILGVVLPTATVAALKAPIEGFTSPAVAPYLLGGGALLSVYTASGYVNAFSRVMNRIWEVEEGRPYLRRRLTQLVVTLLFLLLTALVLTAAVASAPLTTALAAVTGTGPALVTAVGALRWPLLAAAAVLLLVLLYGATPNVRHLRARVLGPGGLLALLLVAAASTGFGVYVNQYSHYGRSYGSLAGIVVLLVWLWIVHLVVLLGGEFDAELERARELRAGEPAERRLQVQVRSTAGAVKRAAALEKEYAQGAALHRPAPHQPPADPPAP